MRILSMLANLNVAVGLLVLQSSLVAQTPAGLVPRFRIEPNPIALAECATGRFMEASGRRAAFLGRTDGRFEAWVYPLKVLHDFELAFQTPAYADPIPGASLVVGADVRPEASTVRYAHAAFTADATWLVPIDGQGGVVLLDVDTSVPLTILVRFRPDLKPMWPAALGGQFSFWDATTKAFVVGEASRKPTTATRRGSISARCATTWTPAATSPSPERHGNRRGRRLPTA